MSIIVGPYFRGDPQVKPKQWGPISAVRSSVHDWFGRHGVELRNGVSDYLYLPFWENAGDVAHNLLDGPDFTCGNHTWSDGGIFFNAAGETYVYTSSFTIGVEACTVLFRLRLEPIASANRMLAEFSPPAWQSPYGIYINYESDTERSYVNQRPAAANTPTVQRTTEQNLDDGQWRSWAVNCDRSRVATDAVRIYLDGIEGDEHYSGTGTGGVYESGRRFDIGSRSGDTENVTGAFDYFLLLPETINEEIINLFHENPYAPIQPRSAPIYSFVTGGTTLVVSEAQSATVIESPALTQKHNLAVDDIASAGSLDQPSLTQVHQLLVDDLTSATSTESVSLSLAILLTVVDALSSAAVDNIALTQKHTLSVDDLASGGILDAVDLNQKHLLAVADLLSASNIDNISFNLPSGIVTISISASGPGITIQAKKPSVIAQ